MACRIGIVINVKERIAYRIRTEWHSAAKILARRLTYEEARDVEGARDNRARLPTRTPPDARLRRGLERLPRLGRELAVCRTLVW